MKRIFIFRIIFGLFFLSVVFFYGIHDVNAQATDLTFYRITENVNYTKLDFSKINIEREGDMNFVSLPFTITVIPSEGELLWVSLIIPKGNNFLEVIYFDENDYGVGGAIGPYESNCYLIDDFFYIFDPYLSELIVPGSYKLRFYFSNISANDDVRISVGYSTQAVYNKIKGFYSNQSEISELLRQAKLYLAYQRPTDAFQMFKQAAEYGNAEAQLEIGKLYLNGKGVTQDYYQAAEWFKKAAEHGLPQAQWFLGECYCNGTGVTIDENQALIWYIKAAEQGSEWAYYLGNLYKEGNCITKDENQAVIWYKKAAVAGDINAKSLLDYLKISYP